MAKPRGTIKRFRDNGKCRNGEKGHGAWRFIFTRQFRMRLRDLAARCVRVVQKTVRPERQRAQGTPGARCTRSLACECEVAHEHSHHRSTVVDPAFPAQWF